VLPEGGTAVLNAGVEESLALAAGCKARQQPILWFGNGAAVRGVRPDVAIRSRVAEGSGQRLHLDVLGAPHELLLPLAGAFQAMNAAAALCLAIATGSDPAAATAALAHLSGVRGRLELVARHASGAPIYVDYAHTPDALATVLAALRPHAARRLVVVFGCGGDRDATKRPLMGEVANDLADAAIVTDDNPRSEEPALIRRAVLEGCPDALEIGDRRLAIESAIAALAADDVLVIAGKGHEQGQIVGDRVLPFDDAEVVRRAVAHG
jgi:UDP-N-acetylmuramoyl-L-alanyl-D-glutamate--2,6-diaminopimelate ligase